MEEMVQAYWFTAKSVEYVLALSIPYLYSVRCKYPLTIIHNLENIGVELTREASMIELTREASMVASLLT